MDGYRTKQSGLIDIRLVILNVSHFGDMWLLLTIEVETRIKKYKIEAI